ncbi:alpha/beta hydrolase [Actinomadura sp. NPDC047616]|uniref:alpha/beta hydrolase n=1 Tax=Actinomadura sp. NPDC047616 TaxID=3155914 RepID=UPI00340D725E
MLTVFSAGGAPVGGTGKGAAAAAAATALALTVLAPLPAAASTARPPRLSWSPCPANDPVEKTALRGMECATLAVPLDHARPRGRKIRLALTRIRHTSRTFQGVVLLNRGGPGAHARDLPRFVTGNLDKKVAAQYDWIGLDPRGVGGSRPALVCDRTYQDPGRPRAPYVPRSAAEERAWKNRARRFADDCARRYRSILPYMRTVDSARDIDYVRAALRQKKVTYFAYSYGTYLGAVYASMYPHRVRRMVLDSVIRPSAVWYPSNLFQNVVFESRIQSFFAWIARNHRTYKLGRTREAVARSYAKVHRAVTRKPVNGRVGPSELDDVFLTDGYNNRTWPAHARALSDYLVRRDPKPLGKLWHKPTWLDQNNYTVYNAVECRDAAWPRNWARWHRDASRLYREGYRFETWSNTWYNAPCAFWRVPGGPKPAVRNRRGLPPMLLVASTGDAATPYAGALETHRLFPRSRLITQVRGGNHGVTFSGDRCVDKAVAAYLATGALPPSHAGSDLACPAPPPPKAGTVRRERRTGPAEGAPEGEPVATAGR